MTPEQEKIVLEALDKIEKRFDRWRRTLNWSVRIWIILCTLISLSMILAVYLKETQ